MKNDLHVEMSHCLWTLVRTKSFWSKCWLEGDKRRFVTATMVDLGGALPAPPRDQNFYNFMGLFQQMYKYIGLATPKGLASPPTTSPGSVAGLPCKGLVKRWNFMFHGFFLESPFYLSTNVCLLEVVFHIFDSLITIKSRFLLNFLHFRWWL